VTGNGHIIVSVCTQLVDYGIAADMIVSIANNMYRLCNVLLRIETKSIEQHERRNLYLFFYRTRGLVYGDNASCIYYSSGASNLAALNNIILLYIYIYIYIFRANKTISHYL